MSRWYDLIAGTSEWKFVKIGLDLLEAASGEVVLDIGYGTGKSVLTLAHSVGATGQVYGLDLSEGMQGIAGDRLKRAGLSERVDLRVGDAAKLPFEDQHFDAVFTSFTLELFDTPEIPIVLRECHRVLRKNGRLILVSMSRAGDENLAVKMYEWAHVQFPKYVDCRPIYVTESLTETGFQVAESSSFKMWGLPVEVVLGIPV